jgi:iron(III) transport system substrate-binding protein
MKTSSFSIPTLCLLKSHKYKHDAQVLKSHKYKPEAQASGSLRTDPNPSLARRACIKTLRTSKWTSVLSRENRHFGSNVQLQKLCLVLFSFVALVSTSGCMQSQQNEVIVYSALDREFSEPILDSVGDDLGLRILPRYDVESNKTVGLANAIIAEQNRPRCDVFWNNEILHTIRLQKAGLLESWTDPVTERFPSDFVSKENLWCGFASRARILIVNTEILANESQWPTSFHDLADEKWKSNCAIARPLFGTSATHAAVMFDQLGDAKASELYRRIAANAIVLGGNKQVAQKVASGEYAFGLTDTDDAIIEIESAKPVAIVFPDQAPRQGGAMLIPNTLCIIKNGPNPERAKKLVNRLLAADIETRLAKGDSAQIPVATDVDFRSRVEPESPIKIMKVDFASAADDWDSVARTLLEIFPTGG